MNQLNPNVSSLPADQLDATWLNPAQRQRDLEAARTQVFDVVVIGAGVTGAGAALDAVTRGLSVLLLDAGDIAVGTSSRSGKTFHGGLRYLEQLNFKLVAHAIQERDLMVKTLCPHIARPESFLYPLTHTWWERPYVGAGVLVYDLMGLKGGAVPLQKHFSRKALKAHVPSIDQSRVVGGIQYFDALMDDARHTLALVRTAAGQGARVVTRAPVVDFLHEGVRVTGVQVKDTQTGVHYTIAARSIINAAGIWADELQQRAGANTFSIQPAKGVHALLRAEAIQSDTGILARATDSVIIARRWYGYWLVGTTDTPWAGGKSNPVAEAADVDYLLDNLNHYLSRKVNRSDVLGVFAGLRPLLKSVGGDADATSALSRDHAVIPGPVGMTTIVGGKYTTYRRMARDAVDAAVQPLGNKTPSVTATLPLVGALQWNKVRNIGPQLARRFGMLPLDVERLLQRHGDRVHDLVELVDVDASLGVPMPDASHYLKAEFVYAVRAEGAMSLVDVLVRRTHLSIELPDGARAIAPQVAALIAPHLDWSHDRIKQELLAFGKLIDAERAALQAATAQHP